MVDTGAESTWIDATALEGIGIERRKKDLRFQLSNGQIVTRSVGYAVLTVDKSETVDEVVFAETGDLQLLGARALEGLNLQVDARRKGLVAAGPIVSAAAVPPRFGRLVQVPPGTPTTRVKTGTKKPKPHRDTRVKMSGPRPPHSAEIFLHLSASDGPPLMGVPKGCTPFVGTVLGISPEPQRMNNPKSLYFTQSRSR